jgi:hypothetical protein
VVANAKTDLDRWLRRVVLPPVDGEEVEGGQSEEEQPGARGRREIRRWQAPEVEVAALLAGTAEPAERQRCIERLRVIGKRWDEDGGVPPAPVESSDETYLAGWRTWYQGRRHLGKR